MQDSLTLLLGASWRLAHSETVVESVASVSIPDINDSDLTALRYESADRTGIGRKRIGRRPLLHLGQTTEGRSPQPHNHEESELESFPGSGEHAEVEMTPETVQKTSLFKAGSTVEGLLKALTPF